MAIKEKHKAAINAYIKNGFNKKQALKTAGYSEGTYTFRTAIVFDREDVKAEIKRRLAKISEKHSLSEEWVIERLMDVANGGRVLAKYKKVEEDGSLSWDFTGATDEELSLINELSVDTYTEGRGKNATRVKKFKVKSGDQLGALNQLSRVLGMFNDKVEVTGGSLTERIQAGRARLGQEKDEDDQETIH